ncbi:unnamed protein product [Effrenium voratum]|nr:unnamed protein product [Effrenium voratum]
MATDEDDPARHPLVVAMRALLRASHGQSGRAIRSAVREAAALAHEVATCGSLGEHDAALSHRESLDGLEADASSVESELRLVWDTLVLSRELPRAEGLDFEEIEELVLAHLLAFPDFLADALVMNFLRQVQLGQSFLHAEDQRINVAAVLQQLQPQLEKHKATAAAIAAECCRHLQDRSETLAGKLLSRMDLDNDGFVGEQDFLKSAVHALALEVRAEGVLRRTNCGCGGTFLIESLRCKDPICVAPRGPFFGWGDVYEETVPLHLKAGQRTSSPDGQVENVAVSAGVQQLLKDESFADDFHEAMCTALIRNGTVQVEG